MAATALLAGVMLAACSTTAPSLAPTIAPTASPASTATPAAAQTVSPTPVPTPEMTFRPLSAADLGEGWTLIATESNIGGLPSTEILANVQVGTSFALICVGTGSVEVSFAAAGGMVTLPPAGANIFFSTTYTCSTQVHEFLTSEFDGTGTSISPNVNPTGDVTYQLIVGTQPG